MKIQSFILLAVLASPACWLAAQTAPPPFTLPPLVEEGSGESHPGKFIWGDLFAEYPLQAAKFYSQLFGWNIRRYGKDDYAYWMLFNGERPVAGVVRHPSESPAQGSTQARWVGYVSVPDLDKAVASVLENGGRVLIEPRSLPDRGSLAVIADSEDTIIGLMHSPSGDPSDRTAEVGDWIWVQLFSRNPDKALAFYQAVFGYEVESDTRTDRENDYILSSEGQARAGLVPLTNPETKRGAWMGFIRVADAHATVKAAEKLGSTILLAPADPGSGSPLLAVLTDTMGGVVGIYQVQE